MHNEYGPMTKTRFLAVMYKNENEKSGFFCVNSSSVSELLAYPVLIFI